MLKYFPLIDINDNFDAVILCDGDYPSSKIPLNILQKASFVCCCDFAGVKHIRRGGKPDAIVGDCDSISKNFIKKYQDIIHIETEQETNDLSKAIRFCIKKNFKNIAIVGATGKREDHTLGNISYLTTYRKKYKISSIILTDYGYFVSAEGNSKHKIIFETFKGQQVSLFNIDCKKIESKGLKWSVYPFKNWWEGTLNEAIAEKIEIKSDGSFLLFRTYAGKI